MPKILSQSGISLADAYDIEGSIAGIETLESRDVSLVHEMGATLFSERFVGEVRRNSTGDVLQSTVFDIVLQNLPVTPFRIAGIQVTVDNGSRLSNCQVSINARNDGRDQPLFVWDSAIAGYVEPLIRIQDNGGAAGGIRILQGPTTPLMPVMAMGSTQHQTAGDVAFRGQTLAFGAGTVEAIMRLYILFPIVSGHDGQESFGLPIPSW